MIRAGRVRGIISSNSVLINHTKYVRRERCAWLTGAWHFFVVPTFPRQGDLRGDERASLPNRLRRIAASERRT